jgi:hypothetical protein
MLALCANPRQHRGIDIYASQYFVVKSIAPA